MSKPAQRAQSAAEPKAPNIARFEPAEHLHEARLQLLEREGSYDSARFFDQRADELDALLATFLDCAFEHSQAAALTLDRAHVSHTMFTECGVAQLHAVGAGFADCMFTGCRFGSFAAMESSMHSVEMRDCHIGYLNLRDATWRDVRFVDCVIDEFDAVGAQLTRVAFPGTRIESINLQHATVSDVDLRGARLHRIENVEYLRGTTMSLDQIADLAAAFAASLGIRVA
ncbi:Pentapeptide repeats (9 copies) [Bifidobacterium pseudolongum subsp. globosum]|uniref:pentapeptide repeat-containing protein n=1 Tax=Bifidobacterium pseudolongum TaxID=1694 RepID=UPI00101EF1DE|nr:pentapeptide repeat-containing protein [Bifidobacterium pseudolongum]RYQ17932.1 Pentapeptide repeats (9 copies) [Bifidobacterium pseudolongum subsp. globosum]